jgi:four helix bundle protein
MNTTEPNESQIPPDYNRSIPAVFDHEKLNVYQMQLRFISWVTPLIEEAKATAAGKTREICDQLDRASLSCLLNTAEGNGKRRGQIRAKFFDDARGSATECAACLDALVAKTVCTPSRILEGKRMLLQVVSMLCGLIERFDGNAGRCSEDPVEYQLSYDSNSI